MNSTTPVAVAYSASYKNGTHENDCYNVATTLLDHSYIVVQGPSSSISLNEIVATWPKFFSKASEAWFVKEQFAQEHGPVPDVLAFRILPVVGSVGTAWSHQQSLLAAWEFIPNVQTIA